MSSVYVSRFPVFKRAVSKNYNFRLLINAFLNLFIRVSSLIISHRVKYYFILLQNFSATDFVAMWFFYIYKWRIITRSY